MKFKCNRKETSLLNYLTTSLVKGYHVPTSKVKPLFSPTTSRVVINRRI